MEFFARNGCENDVKGNTRGMSKLNVCPDKEDVTEMTTTSENLLASLRYITP